jgi:hypothetical protein
MLKLLINNCKKIFKGVIFITVVAMFKEVMDEWGSEQAAYFSL